MAPFLVLECLKGVGESDVADAVEGKPLELWSHCYRLLGHCALFNNRIKLVGMLHDSFVIAIDIYGRSTNSLRLWDGQDVLLSVRACAQILRRQSCARRERVVSRDTSGSKKS